MRGLGEHAVGIDAQTFLFDAAIEAGKMHRQAALLQAGKGFVKCIQVVGRVKISAGIFVLSILSHDVAWLKSFPLHR